MAEWKHNTFVFPFCDLKLQEWEDWINHSYVILFVSCYLMLHVLAFSTKPSWDSINYLYFLNNTGARLLLTHLSLHVTFHHPEEMRFSITSICKLISHPYKSWLYVCLKNWYPWGPKYTWFSSCYFGGILLHFYNLFMWSVKCMICFYNLRVIFYMSSCGVEISTACET